MNVPAKVQNGVRTRDAHQDPVSFLWERRSAEMTVNLSETELRLICDALFLYGMTRKQQRIQKETEALGLRLRVDYLLDPVTNAHTFVADAFSPERECKICRHCESHELHRS